MTDAKNMKLDDKALENVSGGDLDPFRDIVEIVGEVLSDPEAAFHRDYETSFQAAKRQGCRVYEIKLNYDGNSPYAITYPGFPFNLLPGDKVYLEHERDGMYGNTIVEKVEIG